MKQIFSLIALFLNVHVYAQEYTVNGIGYNITSSSQFQVAVIPLETKYTGDIIIPSSVEIASISYTVITIGDDAFANCTELTSIEIPNSVTAINWSAFYGCTELATISISEFVTSIGGSAFAECSSLTAIEVHEDNPYYSSLNGVLYNKQQTVLVQCPGGIQDLVIANTVTQIDPNAFMGCINLSSISIDSNNPYFSSVDGILYNKTITEMIRCPQTTTTVTIPSTITQIQNNAFANCADLISIEIPNTVTHIGYNAFYNCTSLTSLVIPASVTNIESSAFANCSGLTSLTCNAQTPPALGSRVFSNVSKTLDFTVPTESEDLYKTAAQWRVFYPVSITSIPSTFVRAYPNLVIATFNISVDDVISKSTVSIYSSDGKHIVHKDFYGEVEISMQHLNQGKYIYYIDTPTQHFSGICIKQ